MRSRNADVHNIVNQTLFSAMDGQLPVSCDKVKAEMAAMEVTTIFVSGDLNSLSELIGLVYKRVRHV